MTLLRVEGLMKRFPAKRGFSGRIKAYHQAVDDVSFDVDAGETVALVGESGAGKSTTGRLVLRLIEPDAGSIDFDGVDVRALTREQLRRQRRHVQMIFQDPASSLDPRVTIGDSITEPMRVHERVGSAERSRRAVELLDLVGLSARMLDRYPSELSGGQLQRVAITRALCLRPKLVVCDEPVAALDVSVQAQIVNLMKDLQEQLGLAYLFVTHDLALVEVIAERVVVMRSGKVVESGAVANVFRNPTQAYTRELISSVPTMSPRRLVTPERH